MDMYVKGMNVVVCMGYSYPMGYTVVVFYKHLVGIIRTSMWINCPTFYYVFMLYYHTHIKVRNTLFELLSLNLHITSRVVINYDYLT